ncbi:hypothetical protein FHS18_001766 [Paenibacillus phyllosphaerae]|uniref:Uncharacterized protein n=1 Tax=Paenibacillus phyllosphaerae TaxID=274593 RepID=A0A7W5AVY4_9BACL|nr:hypothetical protein [Paenibacillus phyllosphaerae]
MRTCVRFREGRDGQLSLNRTIVKKTFKFLSAVLRFKSRCTPFFYPLYSIKLSAVLRSILCTPSVYPLYSILSAVLHFSILCTPYYYPLYSVLSCLLHISILSTPFAKSFFVC